MKGTVWTFGLIAGAILSVMMLITLPLADTIGHDRGMVIGYTTMVLAFLLVFFGVRSYRDNVAGGSVGFRRALAVGSLIALVASTCYVASWELVYYKLAPDYAARMQTQMIERTRASGESPEVIEKKVADMQAIMEMYRNPAVNVAVTFLEPLPVGLVFALVSAGILGRRRSTQPGLVAAAGVGRGRAGRPPVPSART